MILDKKPAQSLHIIQVHQLQKLLELAKWQPPHLRAHGPAEPRGLTQCLHEVCEVRSSRSHSLHKPEWMTSMINLLLICCLFSFVK